MSAAEQEEEEGLAEIVMAALRRVIDPELGYNIVDLGLIYRVEIDGGAVHVTMTTTTRGCPATDYLRNGAGDAVESALGVESVTVDLTYEPPWTPDMMSPKAKAHLGIGA
ncbi:MAG TPA: metal-sulfur cluster assembly factor [Sphingobium sp.]|nr:metal-sulfur cluster assembly factor [Sphingobium sp.]